MKGVVLGTAGHVDHGKTSLVRALTGVDTDRWEEEKRRGLTIDIGFARLHDTDELEIGVVDVPGHEDFVKNMLVGSTGIDIMLLVVAADEGPMPQTREHLAIARLLGVRHGVVALNKVDRVDEEWRELAREATVEALGDVPGAARWPIVDVSADAGTGLDVLREQIVSAARAVAEREPNDLFRMPVDRSFSVAGAGTVVTGTVWTGTVYLGDTVRVLPSGEEARVRSLQVHGGDRSDVGPGRRCAMALVGIDTASAGRGATVVVARNWKPARRLGARVEVPSVSPRELEHGQRVRLFLGTTEVMARILTTRRDTLRRGETAWVALDCESPVVARVGDHFVLRFYSPITTIAGGRVAELDPPRSWRERGEIWRRVLGGDPVDAVTAAVLAAGGNGISGDAIPLVAGVPASTGSRYVEMEGVVRQIGGRFYAEHVLEKTAALLLEHLATAHRTRPRASAESLESVRAALSAGASIEALDDVVDRMASAGQVVVEGPWIKLPSHEATLTELETRCVERIRSLLADAGLEPPPPTLIAKRLELDRDTLNDLLRLLVERAELVAITPEIYLTAENEFRARNVVRQVMADGRTASPGDFRAELRLTRKYLIPLLEHMDRCGVTRRTSEGRVPGRA